MAAAGNIPFTFRDQPGPIPLSELDDNFQYVSDKVVSVFDGMNDFQIADVISGAATLDVSAACQFVIDSLGTLGGTVQFPAGIYKLGTPLNLPSGVFLEGDSMRATQLNGPAGNYCILATTAVRCGFSKMFLNGAGPGYGFYASVVCTQIEVRDVWFESSVVGTQINDSYFISFYNCSWQSCDTSIAAQIGANDISLNGCQLNNGGSLTSIGIDFQAECASWHVHGTSFEGHQPINIGALVYGLHFDANFHENTDAVNALASAFTIGSFSGSPITPRGISITGSYFNGNINYGVTLKSCEGVKVSNNFFQNKLFAFKIQNFDAPRRNIDLSNNAYNINAAGYDITKAITFDGAYGDALTCNYSTDNFGGLILHGISGLPTAALENGEAALFQTNGAPSGAGLLANRTYVMTKAAGVASPQLLITALSGSTAWTPGAILNGASAATTIPVIGAAAGDNALCKFSLDLQGLGISGYCNALNQAVCVLNNNTGGTVTLGAGVVGALVIR